MRENKMNILHWGPFPNERDGGASVNYWTWTKYYQLFPEDTHFAIPKHPPELKPSLMPFINFLPNNLEKFLDLIDKYKIEVIESFHIMNWQWSKILTLIAQTTNIPFILHQTVHWADDICFKILAESTVLPDYVVAPTHWARQFFYQYEYPKEHLRVIPHGVDTDVFKPSPKQTNTILFVGRFDMWKGVQLLIPLIRPLIEKFDVKFVIRACSFKGLNKSEQLHEVYRRLAKIHEGKVILYDQWLPYNRIPALMKNCDILVFPSGHEGFGVPLIEAMACGKPVITTNLPNMREIVGEKAGLFLEPKVPVGRVNMTENYEGTMVKVPSSEQLMDAIVFLLENPEYAKEMGKAGRERVLKFFDLKKVTRQWKKLFEDAVNERPH